MKLTVVVPTRERQDTLRHTLMTLTRQDYADCEFIVSDNYSQDDTRQVVASFDDPRIVYINTGVRVSMAENWEFALDHARGDFITYIGDDDGFIPGALGAAMRLLEESGLQALVWEKAEYCWPDHVEPAVRNTLSIRLGGFRKSRVSGQEQFQRVMSFKTGYTALPCLYNGIARRQLLLDLKRSASNGLFFNAISPDCFSALALSLVVGDYLVCNFPFSVNGASRHSNGTSFMRRGTDGKSDNPTTAFYSENRLSYDARVLLAPAIPVVIVGEYLLVQKYHPELGLPDPSWPVYLGSLAKDIVNSRRPEAVTASAVHTAAQLGMAFAAPRPKGKDQADAEFDHGLMKDVLRTRAHSVLVTNVADACMLVASLIPDIGRVRWGESSSGRRPWYKRVFS